MIKLLADSIPQQPELAKKLYQVVAARIRTRALGAEDAETIAAWFDALAEGKQPEKVFAHAGAKAVGRPRGKTKKRKQLSTNWEPDDYDVALFVCLRLQSAGQKPSRADKTAAYSAIAQICGMKPDTVKNIYLQQKKTGFQQP